MKITMMPEEKFNQEVWWVLQAIKYQMLSTLEGEPIEFIIRVRPIIKQGEPSPEIQNKIIAKLAEWKALKILDTEEQENTYGKDVIYTLDILQPKFYEVYRKFTIDDFQRQPNDITTRQSTLIERNPDKINIKRNALLKVKRILNCIQKKREDAPKTQSEFVITVDELLDAGQGLIKENDIQNIFAKISTEGGNIAYRLQDNFEYVINIWNFKNFGSYYNQIVLEYGKLEPAFQEIKNEERAKNKNKVSTKEQIKTPSISELQYDYKEEERTGTLKIGKFPIEFKGCIACIVHYFITKKDIRDDYFSFDMYNNFVREKIKNRESDQTTSIGFRQKISAINKRARKETEGFIEEIIKLRDKKKHKEKNHYKWEIKYSNM